MSQPAPLVPFLLVLFICCLHSVVEGSVMKRFDHFKGNSLRIPSHEQFYTYRSRKRRNVRGVSSTAVCQGYVSDGNSCVQCNEGCSICSEDKKCLRCHIGYFKSGDECKPCIKGCDVCRDDSTCLQCQGSYENGICVKCPKNCAKCPTSEGANPTTCTKCDDNYVKGSNGQCTKECSEVISNCEECEETVSGQTCRRCSRSFFMDEGKCSACLSNCDMCVDSTTCYKCTSGHFFNTPSSTCQKCIESCSLCSDSKTCLRCSSGHFASSSQACSPCSDNCDRCVSPSTCLECFPYHRLTSNSLCKPTISFCYRHDAQGKCKQCQLGYALSEDRTKCTNCESGPFSSFESNCERCDETGTKCLLCQRGYYVTDQNVCEKCAEGCARCGGVGGVCQKCQTPTNQRYPNPACFENNADYEESWQAWGRTRCLAYVESASPGKCTPRCAVENCYECEKNDRNRCSLCAFGFYMALDGTCVGCSSRNSRCLYCAQDDPDQCLWCDYENGWCNSASNKYSCVDEGGYCYNEVYEVCSSERGCEECASSGDCLRCRDKYFLLNGRCYRCSNECERCKNGVGCEKCKVGYVLDPKHEQCVKCPSGCSECDENLKCSRCGKDEGSYYYNNFFSGREFEGLRWEHYYRHVEEDWERTNHILVDGLCLKCPDVYCSKCRSQTTGGVGGIDDICEKCVAGFFLSDGRCEMCSNEDICVECLNDRKCKKCVPGFFVSNDGVCKVIEEEGCITKQENNGDECLQCNVSPEKVFGRCNNNMSELYELLNIGRGGKNDDNDDDKKSLSKEEKTAVTVSAVVGGSVFFVFICCCCFVLLFLCCVLGGCVIVSRKRTGDESYKKMVEDSLETPMQDSNIDHGGM